MVTTRLADVHCQKVQFNPGDRLIVRSRVRLDAKSKRQLQRTVERWAGNHVEVLVLDPDLEISIDQQIQLGNQQ